MNSLPKSTRANYFCDETGEEEYRRSFVELLAKTQKVAFAKYMNPENTHRFKHGGHWSHPAAPNVPPTNMKTHSAETEISFDKIVNHDLTVIDQVIGQISESMESQFAKMLFTNVAAAADAVGNTVDAKAAGSIHEAIAQIFDKVQFSADKFGNVTPPSIYLGNQASQALQNSAANAPPEFHQRIEAIIARKTAEALERETQRKARFIRYGESH